MQFLPKPLLKASSSACFLSLARSQMPQVGSKHHGRPPMGLVTETQKNHIVEGRGLAATRSAALPDLLTLYISLHQASLTLYPLVCNNSFNASDLTQLLQLHLPSKKTKCKSKGLLIRASDHFPVLVVLLALKALQTVTFQQHSS